MAVTTTIAIVGAGFGGLGAAVRLTRAGHHDFLILEKADDVGGTWRDNSYPGCACDVPSHLYAFSFALNPHWSETFSGQAEIWDYLRGCVETFGLRPHLRLGHGVERAAWDEATRRWEIDTTRGRVSARYLILATGPLSDPALPAIPGLATFQGVSFHSARWRHDYDLRGQRVGVIGTGASAVQFVPRIQPLASSLTVFQRTPPWIVPKLTRRISALERWVYRRVPGTTRVTRAVLYWTRDAMGLPFVYGRLAGLTRRLALRHLHRQVGDPALRAKLTPTYATGCKRVLLANDYYPALAQPNITLETTPIREIRPHAVVTADGVEHEVDALIFGTGFHVTDSAAMGTIHGRGGVALAQAFTPSMTALRGTTVAGFPNFFMLLGPNTGLGHTSVVLMIESQVRHIIDVLGHARRTGAAAVEPTEQAQRQWTQWIDGHLRRTVWSLGGCVSWYLDSTGRNSTLWPGFATGFRLRLRHFRPGEYTWTPADESRGTLLTSSV
jgi:cation diffusion facilitator CzcD-associated flavoprotein CzcO